MTFLIVMLALLLGFQDPLNDAYGDGSLLPPTAAVYRSPDILDVTEFVLQDSRTLEFSLSFASLGNPHNLPNGFSLPIIEIYVSDEDRLGGSNSLLPGSGMRLANDKVWTYAVQLNGDRVRVFESEDESAFNDITARVNPNLTVNGTTLTFTTSLVSPSNLELFGIVGNYAPFSETGWRPVSRELSPWAYSSSSQQSPVVEVLAATPEAQQLAIQQGLLPPVGSSRAAAPPNIWVILMLLGLLVALAGLFVRIFSRSIDTPGRKPAKQTAQRAVTTVTNTAIPKGHMMTGIPPIDWDAPELNRNINEMVARKKSHYAATPLQKKAEVESQQLEATAAHDTEVAVESPQIVDLRKEAAMTDSEAQTEEAPQQEMPLTDTGVEAEGVAVETIDSGTSVETTTTLSESGRDVPDDTEPGGNADASSFEADLAREIVGAGDGTTSVEAENTKPVDASVTTGTVLEADKNETDAADANTVQTDTNVNTVETIRLKANPVKQLEVPKQESPAPVEAYSLKTARHAATPNTSTASVQRKDETGASGSDSSA